MKKLIALLVILAAGGGGTYYYYAYGKTVEKPQVVELALTQGTIIEAVQATGTLEATRVYPVGSQVSGVVAEVNADFNSIVKKGDVLARVDPALLQVQVQLQEANVARQEGEIANQEVLLEDSKKQLERTQTLFDKSLANQQQLDQAILTLKQRTTALDSARKQLLTNKANLDQAKLNVDYTVIKAPEDGVVVSRSVDVGQTVQASMTAPTFFQLAMDLRKLRLTAMVDESEIGKIQPGMAVNFTVDAYGTQNFEGSVENVRLNALNQQNVVTYPVWINAPNPQLQLRPGMTATVRVIISQAANAIRVPNQALRFRPTTDMYKALGLEPPAPGSRQLPGRGGRDGQPVVENQPAGAPGATPGAAPTAGPPTGVTPAPGQPTATTADANTRQPGQGGDRGGRGQRPNQMAGGTGDNSNGGTQGQGGQSVGRGGQGGQGQPGGGQGGRGGQGFGRGGMQNLSPEERQKMMAQFQAAGGGRGGGGRNRGAGGRGQGANVGVEEKDLDADKIDELFPGVPKRLIPGTVWLWDEPTKKLTEVRVTTGIFDNQWAELIMPSELKVGQKVVTNVVLPVTARTNQNNNIFGPQPGRGGGLQPGFPGGGGPGGGGAGGGGRGGGGGGGRGGN